MTPLRQRTLAYMTIKGYADSTKRTYIYRLQEFALHFNSCPSLLSQAHVAEYLRYLRADKKKSRSTVNASYSAIKILFVHILDKPWDAVKLPRLPRVQKLPLIFSVAEVKGLIKQTENLKHRSILSLFYASGIRLEELCQLRVKDLVFSRKRVFIRQAKGNKDRYALLTDSTITLLREYLRIYRPYKWLFSGQDPARPIHHRSVCSIYKQAKKRVGLPKEGGVHQLRHCFATHMLEQGMNLATLQKFLGHSSLRVTENYLHLTNDNLAGFQHPLDED